MRNLKLILEYDGSSFFGFQRQPHHPTVQEELETALSKLLGRRTKIKSASGRTDSGVHAACQVVHFLTPSRMDCARLRQGLNALLPGTVAVRDVCEMPAGFHARYQAKSKVYEYRIWNDPVRSPLRGVRAHHFPERLDLQGMRRAARTLRGRHDFRSFSVSNGKGGVRKNTVRTVKRLEFKKEGSLLRFRIEADGFLHHMVRRIVGTLLEVGRGQRAARDLPRILRAHDPRLAGATAPAVGLTLLDVTYEPFSG